MHIFRPLLPALFLFALLPGGCRQVSPAAGKANHLIQETSPYLLEHAYNPVDWYPWSEEALNKAKSENKLLIISIGYSACHWCHVMAAESFEDTTVARIMNRYFVNIKVDREERPDVDNVYMDACQLTSKQGCGWPLNAIALPDGKPVWVGTYHPKKAWIEVLSYFAGIYQETPAKLTEYGERLTGKIAESEPGQFLPEKPVFDTADLDRFAHNLLGQMDPQFGGRKGAPKFPMPDNQEFLLAWAYQTGNAAALQTVTRTLDHLAGGGIYDHLDGGFARYATDEAWKIPHFEKMLYDNAQLISLFAKTYAVTSDVRYRKVAEQTLSFIRRRLTSPEGAFYSGIDADSEGEEGRYYSWTERQIDSLIGDPRQADLVKDYFQITKKGNWEAGKNVLYAPLPLREVALKHQIGQKEADSILEKCTGMLLEAREKRPPPHIDDKALCAWNAMMTRAYCDAYAYFGDRDYLEAALDNGHWILSRMMDKDARLARSYKAGKATINGFLDDYGWTILAFTRLYEVTFDESWLFQARRLAEYAIRHFSADDRIFFYYTSDLDPPLIKRNIELEDNVIASSNSVMAEGLFLLGAYFYEEDYLARCREMVSSATHLLKDPGSASFCTNWAAIQMNEIYPRIEVAVTGDRAGALRDSLLRKFMPDVLFLGAERHSSLKLLEGKFAEGRTWIFVCRDKVCKLPVHTVQEAYDLIRTY